MKISSQSQVKTKNLLNVLMWFSMLSAPFNAYAMECSSDADCGEGEYCEQIPVPSAAPCFIDEDGEEVCEEELIDEEEVLGFCEERPIECMEDSDCPSHLSCGWAAEPASGSSSSGSSGFAPAPPEMEGEAMPDQEDEGVSAEDLPPETDEPNPEPEDESMMCVFVPVECESDNDCAMNFHCETSTISVGCAAPEVICEEGEDCVEVEPVDCDEEEYTESLCVPNEIECDNDEACPSDWRCRELVEFSCDSDDITVSTPDSDESTDSAERRVPAPEEDSEEAVEVDLPENNCEETVRSLCVPAGLHGGYVSARGELSNNNTNENEESGPSDNETGSSNGNGQNEEEESASEPSTEGNNSSNNDTVEDEGGCDAQSNQQSSWMLIFALAALAFRRRLASKV